MRFLEFLYYRYYNSQVRMGNRDVAPFSAMLIIAFTIMLYYFDVFIILSEVSPKLAPVLSIKFSLIILLSLVLVLYFTLVHKNKYKSIIKNQEKEHQKKWSLIAILFPLLAFILFNLGFILKILQNQAKI